MVRDPRIVKERHDGCESWRSAGGTTDKGWFAFEEDLEVVTLCGNIRDPLSIIQPRQCSLRKVVRCLPFQHYRNLVSENNKTSCYQLTD